VIASMHCPAQLLVMAEDRRDVSDRRAHGLKIAMVQKEGGCYNVVSAGMDVVLVTIL
jgi:hypothetical protein